MKLCHPHLKGDGSIVNLGELVRDALGHVELRLLCGRQGGDPLA
jgi:hypothetical protein